ncbi:hypothetical protein [Pseudonocardia sp. ICBG601]|nr:hypothetical protein [Pseudonocardia sp. ICBG601]
MDALLAGFDDDELDAAARFLSAMKRAGRGLRADLAASPEPRSAPA